MSECQAAGISKTVDELTVNKSTVTDEDLSEEMKIAVLPVTILIGVEACLGIAGNIFILIIYSLRYRRCNFKYFVICMSLIDLTSCLTTLPGEIYSQLHWYSYKYEWICKTKSYFNVFIVWSSALSLLLLAYDRYRKICRPLDWQFDPSWARRLCVISIAVSAVVSAPVGLLWGKQSYIYEQKYENITVTICEKSGYFVDGNLPFVFITFAYMTPVAIIICIIYVLNFKIAQAIFLNISVSRGTMSAYHKTNTNNANHLNQLTHEHDKSVHETDVPLENISSEIDRQSECTLDTNADLKQCFDTQNSLVLEKHSPDAHGINGKYDNGTLKFGKSDQNGGYNKRKRLDSCCSDTSGYVSFHQLKRSRPSTSSYTSQDRSNRKVAKQRFSSGKKHVTRQTGGRASRLKHKTEIMLILTTVFTVTIIIYLVLISLVASEQNILRRLTENEKATFFFFWRVYFINVLINPFLYGLMDPRFRKGLRELLCAKSFLRNRSTKSQVTSV